MPASSKTAKSKAKASTTKHGKKKAATAMSSAAPSAKKRGRSPSQSESVHGSKKLKGPAQNDVACATRDRTAKSVEQQRKGPSHLSSKSVPRQKKGSSTNSNMESEPEQESERSEQTSDDQPGIDEKDYDDVDLHDSFENAVWGQDGSEESPNSTDENVPIEVNSDSDSDGMEVEVEDERSKHHTSTLSRRQKERQAAERPNWIAYSSHRRSTSAVSTLTSKSSLHALGSPDADDSTDNYNGDPQSIEVIIQRGARYPILTCQAPRVAAVIRQAFIVSEYRIAFQNPYPPLADFDRFFRTILRDAARQVDDDEIAQQVKTNAQYGNLLAHLVKARFTRYRREIRDHAKSEARAVYQLKTGLGQGKRVEDLLLNDTFVYGVDERGNAINSEPYRHPAVTNMIQFFFADNRSIGQRRVSNFKSTFTPDQHEARSRENEVPIAMVAFSATMLWAELLLWKSGSRSNVPFDADVHTTAYEHHVEALEKLRNKFPVRFHNLMHFLYIEGSSPISAAASKGCEGEGVLGRLDWDADSE